MARQRKPATVHKKQGTYQPCRHAGPNLPVEIPRKPKGLSKRAGLVWDRITPQLKGAGLIAALDQEALRVLCESVEWYTAAGEDLQKNGLVVQYANNKGKTNPILNPAWRARKDAWTEIVKMLQQFGMTPTARNGLKPAEQEKADDELDSILNLSVVG